MADITATIIETNIAGEIVDGDTISATASSVPVTTTVTDGDTVEATITEVPVATELVDGDTLTATITEVPITVTVGPLTEVDPIFIASEAFNITAGDITLLTDLSALALDDGNFIVADGANWVAEAGDTARTSLGLGTGDSPTFAGLTLGGVDISTFIDQDVSSGASPTLDGTNFTGIPDGALDENYVNHTLADAANDFLVASGPDTFVIKTLAEAGAILETDIDHGNIQGLGDGSDHTFIDQSVISGSTPIFTGTNFTGIPDGALSTDYVEVAGDTMTGALVIDGSADVVQHTIQANATQTANILEIQKSDGTLYAGVDILGAVFSYGKGAVATNLVFGKDAGGNGYANIFIGWQSGYNNSSANGSVYIGASSGYNTTRGYSNVLIGHTTGYGLNTGKRNVSIGYASGYTLGAGEDNVLLGYGSGYLVRGSKNIFIGYAAGTKQTTLSNLLIVDNQARADIATELTNSILYGVMAATPAAQTLRINANLTVSQETLLLDKLKFTQTDGNEYIDSLADGYLDIGATTAVRVKNLLEVTGDVRPNTDDTYYLGLNDDDSPQAWKGVILADTTDGKYYRIEVINGVVTATDLTD